jgi:hypothetical protein
MLTFAINLNSLFETMNNKKHRMYIFVSLRKSTETFRRSCSIQATYPPIIASCDSTPLLPCTQQAVLEMLSTNGFLQLPVSVHHHTSTYRPSEHFLVTRSPCCHAWHWVVVPSYEFHVIVSYSPWHPALFHDQRISLLQVSPTSWQLCRHLPPISYSSCSPSQRKSTHLSRS